MVPAPAGSRAGHTGAMWTRALLVLLALAAAGCGGGGDDSSCGAVGYVPQTIAAGLSAVEAPPATPTQIALAPNLALVDLDAAASAGIDLGYGATGAGDTAARDVGVELASGAAADGIRLWVDRALPPEVASAYAFDAYRSDDNLGWTAIVPAGPAVFQADGPAFDLPFARTTARYVKLVTRPLATGITTDPGLRSVLVTEAQALVFVGGCAF